MAFDAAQLAELRADFPALDRRRNGKPPIYFNNTCMTLRPRPVIDALRSYYERFPTCGGGRSLGTHELHNWFQAELREHEEAAREAVRDLLGAATVDEVVWTRNTSEAINIVAHGFALEPGDEVLGAEREHNSNLVPWLEAEARLRRETGDPSLTVRRYFELNDDGSFNLQKALDAITPQTKVIAIGHASNLDGTTIPDPAIATLSRKIHAQGGILVLDAAQSVPHRPVDVQTLGVDFLACSFHKMCGPTMGVLYGRYELLNALAPFVVGGDTVADTWLDRVEYKPAPGRFEAGLQDYAGMVATCAAIEYVTKRVGLAEIRAHERVLNARLTERLRPLESDHLWLMGPPDSDKRGGVCTLASGVGAVINAIERLGDERHNIMLRKGMFCVNSYLHRRFDALGSSKNNLRASVYFYNTLDECEAYADVVADVARDPLAHLDDAWSGSPMAVSTAVRNYYRTEIFEKSGRDRVPPNFAPLTGPATGTSKVEGCRGGGKNILEVSLIGADGAVGEIRVSCGLCNPAMYAAADILCVWASGRAFDEILAVDGGDLAQLAPLYALLGGPGRPDDAREKFQYVLWAVQNAVRDHQGAGPVPMPEIDEPTDRDHDDPDDD